MMSKCCKSFNSWSPFLFILLLSIAMALPLFTGKIINLADGPYAFIKAVAMVESWHHGDLVGRWTPDISHGYGYPMFNFYAPLFSYSCALFTILSVPVIWAFNLSIYLALLGSGLAMYLFTKEIFGRQGALIAAVAYMVAPYHILDLYARGALAEFTAFVFFPLFLRAILRLTRKPCLSDILFGIISCAGLILSHNISALFYCAISFFYLIYLFFTSEKRKLSHLIASLSVFAGGALLTIYFWLPALLEKKYVQIDRLLTGIYDYHRNFISLKQLLWSPWPQHCDQLCFILGPVHLCLLLSVVFFAFKIVASSKDSGRYLIFFLGVCLISIFLTLPASQAIWQAIVLIDFAEFPWRFLMCTAAAISILSGAFIYVFKESWRERVMWCVCFVLVLCSVYSWHALGYQDISYTNPKEYLRSNNPMDNMEYLPKQVSRLLLDAPILKLESPSGDVRVKQTSESYLDNYFKIYSENQGLLCYHSYDFPGWKVEINGKPVKSHDNPWGLIIFMAPPGENQVRIYFTKTPLQHGAELVSNFSLIIFILCLLGYRPLNRFLFKP